MLTVEKAFLIGTHRDSFRRGEPAEIVGCRFVQPNKLASRLCYQVRFRDGFEDDVAVEDAANFEIVSETEAEIVLATLGEADEDTETEPQGLSPELEAEIDEAMAEETAWEAIQDDPMDDALDDEGSEDFDPIAEAERNAATAHS